MGRLKDARDANTHQEEGYNAEIKAQTDLANCYKNKASDAEEKCVELTEAVESLQKLLKESSEKYGNVENNLDTEKKAKEEEINRRNEAIRVLRKELDDANDLIKTSKHDINSEDMKLVTRLKDARDANTHQEEGYNAEIKAQTDLANCYKNKASDAEEKCVELTEAVESLQKLLKESSEKYGNVENNLDTEK